MFSEEPSIWNTISEFGRTTVVPLVAQYLQVQQMKQMSDAAKKAAKKTSLVNVGTRATAATLPFTQQQIPWGLIAVGGGILMTILLVTRK